MTDGTNGKPVKVIASDVNLKTAIESAQHSALTDIVIVDSGARKTIAAHCAHSGRVFGLHSAPDSVRECIENLQGAK